ncbi:hypothetical protein HD554DRAFT_381010 [Boletus coccyginus]|nr:hypothetical protein HD554DRAFT_381010 [Boletus coccyginus]
MICLLVRRRGTSRMIVQDLAVWIQLLSVSCSILGAGGCYSSGKTTFPMVAFWLYDTIYVDPPDTTFFHIDYHSKCPITVVGTVQTALIHICTLPVGTACAARARAGKSTITSVEARVGERTHANERTCTGCEGVGGRERGRQAGMWAAGKSARTRAGGDGWADVCEHACGGRGHEAGGLVANAHSAFGVLRGQVGGLVVGH